jgi:hypothetical protein
MTDLDRAGGRVGVHVQLWRVDAARLRDRHAVDGRVRVGLLARELIGDVRCMHIGRGWEMARDDGPGSTRAASRR